MPKDINYQAGKGRISYYADDGNNEANGLNNEIIIGGLRNEVRDDGDGPGIKGYLNDEKFVNGGLTSESPVLILKLTDSSGINTVGTGIGHNLTAVIDGNTRDTIILNDFYLRFFNRRAGEKESMQMLRVTTIAWGALGTAVALAMTHASSALDAWWLLAGIFLRRFTVYGRTSTSARKSPAHLRAFRWSRA